MGTPLTVAIALLPTPMAGDFGADKDAGPVRPSGAKRQTGLPDVIIHRLIGQDGQARTAEPGEGRLLPTPDTGCSPNGHGRRGGRPGNGHQSGQGLDVAATTLMLAPEAGSSQVVWAEYEPAIRRWEGVLGYPAPPPAEPGPSGRPRLSAAFAEWMMGLAPGLVTGVPGIPRTRQLKIIGNGVVPQQAAAALRLLIGAAAIPAVPDGGIRAAA
jgi:DNA (cytosine-5)-methyltransferase 1